MKISSLNPAPRTVILTTQDIVSLKCISVEQPIGVFYIGAMEARDLVEISWTDVRRIAPVEGQLTWDPSEPKSPPHIDDLQGLDGANAEVEELDQDAVLIEDQDFEQFLGIQRDLNPGRVSEIKQYVTNVDATFPTAVLLAISPDHVRYDEKTNTLSVVRHSKVAKVIDGQHRIAGLTDYAGPRFQVNVAIFIDMDIQDQAMVFATINLKQTKVNKSLAYDLYEFTTARSPQRTCHDVVRFLNYRQNSPFEGKIKMLGVGRYSSETITQATFIDRLLRMISTNPMADRDLLKRGRRLTSARTGNPKRQIFRNLFIRDSDDLIVLILWNFFTAVSNKWPNSWGTVATGNVLNRTTGFGALIRFMRVAYLSMGRPDRLVTRNEYKPIFDKITLQDGSFSPETYLPGSSGEKALFDELVRQSQLQSYAS